MNKTQIVKYDVLIIGSGYSGTMVAINLVRMRGSNIRIALLERRPEFGRGVAYGTTDSRHLLNVPAKNMGAFPDDTHHFYNWLQRHPDKLRAVGIDQIGPDAFIPRILYGSYIQDLLSASQQNNSSFDLIQDEAVDLVPQSDGAFRLELRENDPIEADHVVLAVGNFPPGELTPRSPDGRHHLPVLNNPYSPAVRQQLAAPGDVLIVGSGLTSLDLLLSIKDTKKEGVIHILSRRGLFPQPHAMSETYKLFLDSENLPKTALELCRIVRREVRRAAANGIGWRSVVDSMRPFNQLIWQGLTETERKLFLRRLKPFWDTHRHRCASEIIAVKQAMEETGRLISHRGHINGMKREGQNVEVSFRSAESGKQQKLTVHYVVNCTGPQSNYKRLNDTLIAKLLARGLISPDPMSVGLATADDGSVLDHHGYAVRNLFTVGSPQVGRLYESIAVPELRVQTADLARTLVAKIVSGSLKQESIAAAGR
jgi:uncharacterized NAD(P)/FAD-binding protein YdhS